MGESSIDGVLREVKEEVGLDLKPETGKLLFTKRSFSMCLSARQLRGIKFHAPLLAAGLLTKGSDLAILQRKTTRRKTWSRRVRE